MPVSVRFYPHVDDALYRYAVIVSRMDGRMLFCRHRDRSTWECPGGHREPGEPIMDTARRELHEETGATDFSLTPVCAYSVARNGAESFGMLYRAEVRALGALPPGFEMAEVRLFDEPPASWTYPDIQPLLLGRALEHGNSTER